MSSSNKSVEMSGLPASSTKLPSLLVIYFVLVCLLPFALAWDSTRLLLKLVLENETFSQIPLIPLVSLFLIYEQRKAIFAEVSFDRKLGATLIIPGMILV